MIDASSSSAQLPPIVSAQWLSDRLAAPHANEQQVMVADVRWYLDGRSGREAYEAAHIGGAVFIDMDEVLSSPATATDGRHPMPSPEQFAAGLAAAGIAPDTPVVAYDDLGGMTAGRLVWMLRILGCPAALLDGGLPAWAGTVEAGAGPAPAPIDHREPVPWPSHRMATADEVAAYVAEGGVVVDSRSADRYRGETEPVDTRAGHVPGAVNLPFAGNLDETGLFRTVDELAGRFDALKIDETSVFYCGSGVSACHNVLAAEAAGKGLARLYVGSWSQWSADPERPLATGEAP